jgi:hypothetical protein
MWLPALAAWLQLELFREKYGINLKIGGILTRCVIYAMVNFSAIVIALRWFICALK